MDISNWINLGILIVTAFLGILSWLGARQSSREAQESQEQASTAAARSAAAAEDVAKLQRRIVEIETQRHEEAALDARRAKLHAELAKKTVPHGYDGKSSRSESFLVIANSGHAGARRIKITLNHKPISEYDEFVNRLPPDCSIGPGGRIELHYMLLREGKLCPPFTVALEWEDESPIRGAWAGTV